MIKCPQCGEENQVGSIFCRGCGDQLDLDKVRPADLKRGGEETKVKTSFVIVRNFIILMILFAIGATTIAAFMKPEIPTYTELNAEQTKTALKKFRKFRKGPPGSEHTFDINEFQMLTTLVLKLSEEEKIKAHEQRVGSDSSSYVIPDALYVEFLPPNETKFILNSKLFNKINFYTTLVGTALGSKNGLVFTVSHTKMGKLPFSIPFENEPLLEIYRSLIRNNDNFKKEIQPIVKEIKFEPDRVVLKKVEKKRK